MPELNPYEPPQTDSLVEKADPASLAEHVEPSFNMLFSLQWVFFVAIAICLLLMPEPRNWVEKLYHSLLWGNALTSLLIALLAAFYSQWGLILLEAFFLIGSVLLLNYA